MKRFIVPEPGVAIGESGLAANFSDLHPPLTSVQAATEAFACLFCYEAPCVTACPTAIDIPGFIHSIRHGNPLGAGERILSANILGGTCARACPTEILCEGACVVNDTEGRAVKIGRLQRFAVDAVMDRGGAHPFPRAADSGRRIAIVGAGPAGLAFAHCAAMLGHRIVVYDAQEKPGGLNEYGLAAYKMADDFAQREVAFLLGIGGIELRQGRRLGRDFSLSDLQRDYDGVFLALGLEQPAGLGIPGEALAEDALGFIAALRRDGPKALPVGTRIAVIGGGNTAIDAAVQARAMGAGAVDILYRRGRDAMGATPWEQELAANAGVHLHFWTRPVEILGTSDAITLRLTDTQMVDGRLESTGSIRDFPVDRVLAAVGQRLHEVIPEGIAVENGRIRIDPEFRTSLPMVFAGGDCVTSGADLTVQAVEDGKRAARAMDRDLRAATNGTGRQGDSHE